MFATTVLLIRYCLFWKKNFQNPAVYETVQLFQYNGLDLTCGKDKNYILHDFQ